MGNSLVDFEIPELLNTVLPDTNYFYLPKVVENYVLKLCLKIVHPS